MMDNQQRKITEEFKREAVRLTETSGGTAAQIATDLDIGKSMLTQWKTQFKEALRFKKPCRSAARPGWLIFGLL